MMTANVSSSWQRWRYCLLILATTLAAYISLSKLGGLMVFGFQDLVTFCLFALPCLPFPVALLGFWKPYVSAFVLFLLTIIFLAAILLTRNFSFRDFSAANTWISLYLVDTGLLTLTAIGDHLYGRRERTT
jgi:hypothetical protein